jgi:tRNA-splicing ligase RtcB (3'-phosphate/5'-hydroxy nucleic acid ligase)
MYKFKNEGMNVPCYVWSEKGSIEESCIQQMENISSLPFAFHHTVLNADGHTGYGMPIGGVLATEGVVICNCVGVDIGCGMCAVRTSIKYDEFDIDTLKRILGGSKELKGGIRSHIPVGRNHHKKAQEWAGFDDAPMGIQIIEDQLSSAAKQLGTLGGGNHFIEIQKGDDGHVWIMVHSGSRNFGYQIAKTYNKIAQDLCKKWHSNIPEPKGEDGLAFLPIDSDEGQDYLTAMNYALDFALASRLNMIEAVKKEFLLQIDCTFDEVINKHHNFATMENHFGRNVMVHRKGATSARKGEFGIIPGSQGTFSYIVEGKGNSESFCSCSHGAGRKMSRTKAQNELNLEEEQEKLNSQGILHAIRGKNDLDEAAGAYKDIGEVMANQSDLVDIKVELSPLAVIKG